MRAPFSPSAELMHTPARMQRHHLLALLGTAALLGCGSSQTANHEPGGSSGNESANARAVPLQRTPSGQDPEFTIRGQLGYLSTEQLSAVLTPATPQLAQCYTDRLADHPYLSGRVELKIRIGEDGVPLWVIPLSTTLGDRAAEQCMIERAMALRFPRPRGGETETRYPLDLDGGDDVRPATEWPSSRLESALASRRAAIGRCTNGVAGPYQLTVYAAPRGGSVASAGVGVPTVEASRAVECILREVNALRLPDPGSWYARATLELP